MLVLRLPRVERQRLLLLLLDGLRLFRDGAIRDRRTRGLLALSMGIGVRQRLQQHLHVRRVVVRMRTMELRGVKL